MSYFQYPSFNPNQSEQPSDFMGYQCLQSERQCIPVFARTTYDQYFPLYDSMQECAQMCGMSYSSYGSDNLDIGTGPKKAPKSFTD